MKYLTYTQFVNERSSTNNLPLLYHGTKKNFDSFDLKYFGSNDKGWLGYGVYLTNDYEYAESYGKVLECVVNIKNPYTLSDYRYSTRPNKLNNELGVGTSKEATKKLLGMGYDSVILRYADDMKKWLNEFIEICVFNPKDIKIIGSYEQGDDSVKVNKLRGYR